MRRRLIWMTSAVLALSACGGAGGGDLESSDPEGHAACVEYLEHVYEVPKDQAGQVRIAGNMQAAEHAFKATTPEIKAAAESYGADLYLADHDALVAACQAHGYVIQEGAPASIEKAAS